MKKSNHKYAVILAGGQGSRFWPLSRSLEPKQFLSLFTDNSLFQDTVSRIKTIIQPENIFIVTNQLYSSEIFNFSSSFKIPRGNIICEPEGKNTAPSIGAASRLISLVDPEASMVVLPSDHRIKNQKEFSSLLHYAFSLVQINHLRIPVSCSRRVNIPNGAKNNLITFGIFPDYPATGYGYIKVRRQPPLRRGAANAAKLEIRRQHIYKVARFIEKPNIERAKRIFKDKRYFWNSGIFVGSANIFLEEIKRNIPSLYKLISQIYKPRDIKKIWSDIKPISFDYGVLEKTKDLLMIPAFNLGWSDLGTLASLDIVLPKDKLANTIKADAITLGSRNITVFGKNRLIACLGLENLIIVDTPDALLITRKDKSEDVKKVVDVLKKNKREEVYLHKTVKRPWGRYTVLEKEFGFKIRLVEVFPKKALMLQKHSRRSEHWVVVEGKAKITKGKRTHYVNANESTFIPPGCIHRLENPTGYPLKIVEVQSGDYLEEDDIIRIKHGF